jgi:hypothetical protein
MPGLYLGFIILSIAGVSLAAWRYLPGTLSRRLLAPIGAVLLVFLVLFDGVGAARGWFTSDLDWVIALVPPGIPPEEPLLLAFLALFSVVVLRVSRRALGEPDA